MEPPAAKRQKVTIACDECRSRKAKCDGNEPVCGPCQRRSSRIPTECTWSASSRLHTSNNHIRRLQDRIAELEGGRSVDDDSLNSTGENLSSLLLHRPAGGERERPGRGGDPAVTYDNVGLEQRDRGDGHVDDPSPVYTVIGPTVSEENREGFFGSSSAGTFMQNVSQMVEQRLNGTTSSGTAFLSPPGGLPGEQRTSATALRSKASPYGQEEIALPLRRTADELMQAYWNYFHPTFPVLDEIEMQQAYESMWTGKDEGFDQRLFLCLLNTVFAISSQINPATKPKDRARLADRYYARAQTLLDIFRRGSLQTVQALLLLSVYCQSSSNAHQCWIFMGLAIRVAQGLGLHSAQTSERAPDTRTREIYRRVWHGCLLLDQIVSSTCGRPCAVGPRNTAIVPLPLVMSGSDEEIVIQHFNHSIKLCRILHETIYSLCSPSVSRVQSLDELYDQYFGHDPHDSSKPSVFDVDRDLRVWREGLPAHFDFEKLSISSNETASGQVLLRRRLAVMLHQNYLIVRMLLLRPFLSAVITFEPSLGSTSAATSTTSLPWNISVQCAVACVRAAQDSISLLHAERAKNIGDVGNTSTWWFNVLFIYTAATVLIASMLSPAIQNELSEISISTSWQLALEILDGYTAFGTPITRLATTLRILHDTVPRQHSYRKRQRHHQQRYQRQTSKSADTFIEVAGDDRTVRWRLSSPPTPQAGQPATDAWTFPGSGQYLSFSPLPGGLFDAADDPFDLAWLTDLPLDLDF